MPHSLSQSCSYVMLRVWRMLAEKERRCFYVRSTLNAVSSKIEVLGYAIEKNGSTTNRHHQNEITLTKATFTKYH